MKTKSNQFGAFLVCIALTLSISGCSESSVKSAPGQISKIDIHRLTSLPKLEGYFPKSDLETRIQMAATPQHVVGVITSILTPVSSRLFSGDLVEWVPIIVKVEKSKPSLPTGELMLRLYPTSDPENQLLFLKVGQRVLAMGSVPILDDSNHLGSSLGSIFLIGTDGNVYNFDSTHTLAGTSSAALMKLNLD